MNFSELPPSKQWAPLKHRGETLAEVWIKPEGDPFALTFRIPQKSLQTPGIGKQLTTENLLKAVGIAPEELESWRRGDVSHAGMNGSNPELRHPLLPLSSDDTHLSLYVSLKRPPQIAAPPESGEQQIPSTRWQHLEARWNAILGLEGSIESIRLQMDGLRAEMEASWSKTLSTEEKIHALNADVAQWNKAKSRVHHSLPKLKEFVHRATWVMGTQERKMVEDLFKDDIRPDLPSPDMDRLAAQFESLLKERQVLSAQGAGVYQECKGISQELQGALRTLQNNAAARADQKRHANKAGGKFFKHVRRWSGAG